MGDDSSIISTILALMGVDSFEPNLPHVLLGITNHYTAYLVSKLKYIHDKNIRKGKDYQKSKSLFENRKTVSTLLFAQLRKSKLHLKNKKSLGKQGCREVQNYYD